MTFDNKSRKKNFTQAKRDRNHTETDVWRNKKKKLFVLFFIFCFRLCCSSLDGRTSLSGHTLTAWTDCVLHFLALSSKNSLFTTWWCWDVLPFAIGFRWFKRSINRVLCMVHWAEVCDFEPLKGIAFIRIHLHLTTKKKTILHLCQSYRHHLIWTSSMPLLFESIAILASLSACLLLSLITCEILKPYIYLMMLMAYPCNFFNLSLLTLYYPVIYITSSFESE